MAHCKQLHKLTGKMLKFAEGVASGKSQTQAYVDAGYSVKSRDVAEVNGSALMKKPAVGAHIDLLRSKSEEAAIMTLVEKRKALADFVRSHPDEVNVANKIRAIDIDAKLAGHYAPEKVELAGSILGQILGPRK